MAPEFAPALVVLDTYFQGDLLAAALHYAEPRPRQLLRVRWAVTTAPSGFTAVGPDVAFVRTEDQHVNIISVSADAHPVDLGDRRYRWQEGLQFGLPWMMLVLVLPADWTLREPKPRPRECKVFARRAALYWILKGDDTGHTRVEWTMKPLDGDLLESEVQYLNRHCCEGSGPEGSTISVDDAGQREQPARPDIFLSYAREDQGKADVLAGALIDHGWSVWWDRAIPAGQVFDKVIETALDRAKCVVVLWSKAAIESEWVRVEAAEGSRRNILVPVLIEEVLPPLAFRALEAARLVGWERSPLDPEFSKLARAVAHLVAPASRD